MKVELKLWGEVDNNVIIKEVTKKEYNFLKELVNDFDENERLSELYYSGSMEIKIIEEEK